MKKAAPKRKAEKKVEKKPEARPVFSFPGQMFCPYCHSLLRPGGYCPKCNDYNPVRKEEDITVVEM